MFVLTLVALLLANFGDNMFFFHRGYLILVWPLALVWVIVSLLFARVAACCKPALAGTSFGTAW